MFPATFVLRTKGCGNSEATRREQLQQIYASGVPFFTKTAIREAVRAFDSILIDGHSEKSVFITGVDGATVAFRLRVGEIVSGSSTAFILKEPRLCYHPIEMMMGLIQPCSACSPSVHDHECGYLPMSVCHEADQIDATTREVIQYYPMPPKTEIQEDFIKYYGKWRASEAFCRLKSIFQGRVDSVKLPTGINKVVAFALGSHAFGQSERAASASQHALVLSVRGFLQAKGGTNVTCYAQDPDYQTVDRVMLSTLGVTVLDDPRALLEIDQESVVVAIHPAIPVRQIVADITRPAVLIWHRDTYKRRLLETNDPTSPRVERMLKEHYVEVECPFDSELFRDTTVYVRKLPF
ncbi:uncharacterized protein B0T15DRAFT_550403 [Chaetomium strumarium]|uniref:SRR1-like domain-containing protein n=1 Tax=Chaetomium strumarium TaxID=1170767 RepID=A0AAJ0GYC9_9PEZI|nr:hypothetical protein B0T15DRAFT_550403 [Chaetomium strumarium]